MEADKKNVLIVWVPSSEAKEIQAYQDYIVDCLEDGVLILPSAFSCEVMELPPLGGVVMRATVEANRSKLGVLAMAETLPEVSEVLPENAVVETGDPWPVHIPESGPLAEAEKKRTILQRVKDYRWKYGLGSLQVLASKTARLKKDRISVDVLRDMCRDIVKTMLIEDWRKISRALDLLEKEAQKENG